ncbi:ImmA/IrrE family metallo-endopeptidase [Vagococcus fluvialis]|uniref:ImmA/IrrE family metallo-endopeptidase n=1 Tax=Vagococcus fluvialis TaxID=2738 RepID=UPI0037D5D329
MQNYEMLMSQHDDITYIFDRNMPNKHKGLYIDNTVYLNQNQSAPELFSTVAEEIGHHLTSYGDIIDQSVADSRRQEKKARYVASLMTVSLEGLIDCSENGLVHDYECAEFLEVTLESFKEAIELYQEKLGLKFIYNGYHFSFETAGSLNIKKENYLEEI